MTTPSHLVPSTKIVVVEDDKDDTFLLLRQLKKIQLDSDVTVIPSGYAAYNHLLETSQPPSLLFLDLHLPGISGLEILKKLREVRRLREVPVIILTGSVNPKDEAECAKYNVSAFLIKPVSVSTFVKSVAHLFPERDLKSSVVSYADNPA